MVKNDKCSLIIDKEFVKNNIFQVNQKWLILKYQPKMVDLKM
jgi:hypothetical protein